MNFFVAFQVSISLCSDIKTPCVVFVDLNAQVQRMDVAHKDNPLIKRRSIADEFSWVDSDLKDSAADGSPDGQFFKSDFRQDKLSLRLFVFFDALCKVCFGASNGKLPFFKFALTNFPSNFQGFSAPQFFFFLFQIYRRC